ncbi:hypothetical protein [Chryseobacterium sp.]|uniref:hypothetical protein n=1 Tax=Chryseobacterium sp. TaxID=1871047 RepID=UPI0025C01758|nr:hypothetical protein [Chryseobacterium sp.]
MADNKKESKKGADPVNNSVPKKGAAGESQNQNAQQMPLPVDVQQEVSSGKNVRIKTDRGNYKIIVDRWEGDSLVAHPVRNSNKILKFHKNQINSEKIAEKRFSQPIADIITVTAYAGIAALVWYLLK